MQRLGWRIVVSVLLLAAMAGVTWAQGGFTLGRYSAEHSGALATGGGYTLHAAIGQADAGGMSGGGFVLAGGFLTGSPIADAPLRETFLPQVER